MIGRMWGLGGLSGRALAYGTVLLATLFVGSATASAAAPNLFWTAPEDHQPGERAGQFQRPKAIAADPATGDIFVADQSNARIDELTVWGEFVKAWGWGVTASGPDNEPPKNEQQQLTVSATGGTYRLALYNVYRSGDEGRQKTVPISPAWPASDPGTPGVIDSVEEALQNLPSFQSFPGSVVVTGGPGDESGSTPYQIEFTGEYADKDIPPLEETASTLTGGGASAEVSTLQTGGSFEICTPSKGDVCQAGQQGGHSPGEMPEAEGGIAFGEGGKIYVFESIFSTFAGAPPGRGEGYSFRVQEFSAEGHFLTMWGGEVNKTKTAEGGSTEAERNLCTQADVEAGDVCGTGVPGPGDGQFGFSLSNGNRIAVGPEGNVFVGDVERIQKFSPDGTFLGEWKDPGETFQHLAMDGSGNFYAVFLEGPLHSAPNVHKLTPAGEGLTEALTFAAKGPSAIALDASGNLYIADSSEGPELGQGPRILAYKPDGSILIGKEEHFAEGSPPYLGLAVDQACSAPSVDIYASSSKGFVDAYGPVPTDLEACPPPKNAPTVAKQFASEVASEGATLKAGINPQFWPDARYYVEYGTGSCKSGGCPGTQPVAPGTLLTGQVTKQVLMTEGVQLSGLAPATTYHFRFVAQSSGGGPVFGVDPDGSGPEEASFEKGLEGTFRTRAKPAEESDSCSNSAFRAGAARRLPDCRAYEMVSPVNKEGGDILPKEKVATIPLSLNQSSADGEKLTYSSYRAFGDVQSAPISSTYIASRTSTGWSSHGISPSRGRNTWEVAQSIEIPFKAFSSDLCETWLINDTTPPLTAGASPGYANVYHRENCGESEGTYEALIPTADEEIEPKHFIPEFQGVSADGRHAIFQTLGNLAEGAVSCAVPGQFTSCPPQLYESSPGGGISFVCVLPNNSSAPKGCSAGSATGANKKDGRDMMVHNAVSADGSRVFWSDAGEGNGKIYVRIDGTTTLAVSKAGETLSGTSSAQYFTAAADGSRAIYAVRTLGNDAELYEFVLEGQETKKIAGKIYGLLGASEDAQRIYLVSGEDLDEGAVEGKPNLYLYEAGEGGGFTFIATLSSRDAGSEATFSPVSIVPRHHTAQVTADGGAVAFMSRAPLTGFDNTDANSDEPDAEVFHYNAETGQLSCVSCNPTLARPSGRNLSTESAPIWAAAKLSITQTQLYQTPKVLAAKGGRLYFESFEALVGADTNGKKDVYQWEEPGVGGCEETSPSFDAEAHGCVDLISSGHSNEDSSLVEVSDSGKDVFFATEESLLPQDPGLVDIYDARVGGGFPSPIPPPPCEGEGCPPPPPPPPGEVAPGSSTFVGPGNHEVKPKPHCPKGKHLKKVKGKKRCVAKKKHHKHKHKHHKSRRAGR